MTLKKVVIYCTQLLFAGQEMALAQTFSDDSLVVRAILDANGLVNVKVESITSPPGGPRIYATEKCSGELRGSVEN